MQIKYIQLSQCFSTFVTPRNPFYLENDIETPKGIESPQWNPLTTQKVCSKDANNHNYVKSLCIMSMLISL